MKVKGFTAVSGLVVLLALAGSVVAQEDAPADEEAPVDEPAVPAATEPAPAEKTRSGLPLYFEVGYGASTPEDFNSSIETSTAARSDNTLSFEDQVWARTALGWKLPDGKGDFRIVFDGFKEDGYAFRALGRQAALDPAAGAGNVLVVNQLPWWLVTVEDGTLNAQRTPPQWTLADDANNDGSVTIDEVRYIGADLVAPPRQITDDMQNRFQTVDAMYGRAFGRRRFSSRWWGGLRYFKYEGNVPAAAWLNLAESGEGFTEGGNLRLLRFSQDTTSVGPIGLLEIDVNFFSERLVLYAQGMAGFFVTDLETDSGDFVTQVQSTSEPVVVFFVPAQVSASRTKSTWQNGLEAGVRLNLKSGIGLNLAYRLGGYLDTVLLPTTIQIPENIGEAAQGSSALFNTQDIVTDGWRASVSFQF